MFFFEYTTQELNILRSKDKTICKIIDENGKIEREIIKDPFEALITSIISQQISIKSAETVKRRLLDKINKITAQNIEKSSLEEIKKCGMSFRKASYIKGIAKAEVSGEINFESFNTMEDKEIIEKLSSLNGVGIWTAEMLLIFSLGRKNILSYGDLVIRNTIKDIYKLESLTKKEFEKYKEMYSPYASIASLYLWKDYKNKSEKNMK